jgi:tRNA pseudouridine-54 N-methylase
MANILNHLERQNIAGHRRKKHIAGGFGHHIDVHHQVMTNAFCAMFRFRSQATATLLIIGKTIPPARAVFDGVAGDRIRSKKR